MISRRRFFQNATGMAAATVAFQASAREERDAFDALPQSVWTRARNNGLVMIHRPAPSVLTSRAQIVSKDEPGKPLIVEGQVFTPEGTPAAGITVYAYNTDAEGYYGAGHTEYPPRLYGWMKTDAGGRFELRTILPGSYPGMRVPAHVHFTLWGDAYPPQWVEELQFAGDPYLTAANSSAAAELRRTQNGLLHCQFQTRLHHKTNFK